MRRCQISRAVVEACEARRLLAGQLDTTWGDAGVSDKLFDSSPNQNQNTFTQIAEDSLGFVLAMTPSGIARYDASGRLDVGFGTTGVYSSQQRLADFVALSDRSVLLFLENGWARRLTPNGHVDATFAEVRVIDDLNVRVKNVERLGDGYILAGDSVPATPDRRAWTKRVDAHLQPVTSYGNSGVFRFSSHNGIHVSGVESVAFASDGSAIIAATVYRPSGSHIQMLMPGLIAVRPDGTRNNQFGSQGIALPQEISHGPLDVSLDSFGRVVLSATAPDVSRLVFQRFNANGSRDLSFGVEGSTALNLTNDIEAPRQAITLPDGAIIAVGVAVSANPANQYGAIVKLDPSGSVDVDFASNGRQLVSLGQFTDFFAVTVDASGRVLAGGVTSGGSAPSFASVVRLTDITPASLTYALDNRTLILDNGPGKDTTELLQVGSSLRVRGAGRELFFNAADFDSISIQTGDASDTLILRGVTTPLNISLGAGHDLLDTDGLAPITLSGGTGRDSIIATGAGDIVIDSTAIHLSHRISLSSVERWFVNGTAGADSFLVRSMPSPSTHVNIDLRSGSDNVRITAPTLGTLAFVGTGNKSLTLDHSSEVVARVYERIVGRVGFDGASFDTRVFSEVTIRAGSGDDSAFIQPALVPLTFDGGLGTDRLDYLNVGIIPPIRIITNAGTGRYDLHPFASVSFNAVEVDTTRADQIAPEASFRIERFSRLAVIVETYEPLTLPSPEMIVLTDVNTGQVLPSSWYSILPATTSTGFGFEIRLDPTRINGRYNVMIPSSVLTDAAGNVADAQSVELNHLRCDANDDGAVGVSDLLTMIQNFGRSNATRAQGDFDYDGLVGFSDLLMIIQDFGRTLIVAPRSQPTNGARMASIASAVIE